MEKVKHIYEHLFEFEKNKRQGKTYPIHKPLSFSEEEKAKGIHDISDLVIGLLSTNKQLHVLDAGCGVGFTLLKLCSNPGLSGLGISVSKKELQLAKKEAKRLMLDQKCKFDLKSYDEDLGEGFDAIICIESLKHAPNWKNTLGNLKKHLSPEGSLLIVEDYFGSPSSLHLSKRFQKKWGVPDLFSESSFRSKLSQLQLSVIEHKKLDSYVLKKNPLLCLLIQKLIAGLSFFLPRSKLKTLLDIYEGAVIMDYFYAQQHFSYQLYHLQVSE